MTLQAKLEHRGSIVSSMRALTDQAETEQRDLNENELKQFDDFKVNLRTLDNQIERTRVIEEAERALPVTPRPGFDGDFETQCRSFSICKAIANRLEPGSVDAGRENEISQELARRDNKSPTGILVPHEVFMEKRAMLTSGSGAPIYPTRHRDDMFVDRLRENLVVGQLGATVLSGLSGEQTIPRLTGSTSAYWVAEHTDVTRSDLSFDSFSMSPKTVGAETEYSRRMIINASPSIEQMVRNDLADTLATEIDRAAINADGTGNMPTGILATAGLKTIDISSVTWYRCLELVQTLTEDRALRGNLGWLVNPRTLRELRITVKEPSNEQFLVEKINELAGYGLFQSNHVPSDAGAGNDESPVIFGNWSDFMIGYWSSVDLLVNPYHQDVYSKGGVLINVLQDLDMAVRHPESFVVGTGLTL